MLKLGKATVRPSTTIDAQAGRIRASGAVIKADSKMSQDKTIIVKIVSKGDTCSLETD